MSADLMDFGDALKAMRLGFKVAREEEFGDYIRRHHEIVRSSNGVEFILTVYNDGPVGAFEPHQSDILATDWGIV